MEESGSEIDDTGGPTQGKGPSRRRAWIIAVAALLACAAVLFVLLYLFLWRGDSPAGREKAYKDSWRKVMEEFDKRVTSDDKKAEAYSEKGDISAVIILVRQRIEYFEDVIERLLDLEAPPELRRLHVATLHYIFTLVDQLKTQNDLNEAALAGNPTEDLKAIADNAVARAQLALRELSIEMQGVGVVFGESGKAP